jgi:hypothetical protein
LSCVKEPGFSDLAIERLSDLTSQSITPPIIQAICHFNSISKEKEPIAKTLTEVQSRFTTKDTKSTKESENEALDPAIELGGCSSRSPVYYTPRGDITQPIAAFDGSSSSILRVLRALRGELSLASVLCEPKVELTTHSKPHETIIRLFSPKWDLEN